MATKFKQTLILSLLLFSVSAFAETPLKTFICGTSYPTTTYVIENKDDLVSLSVLHHNGVEYAPLFQGSITSEDFNHLEQSKKNLKKIGARFSFKFKKSSCSNLKTNRITCFHSGATKLGELEIKDLYLNIYENTNLSPYGEFKDIQINLEYRLPNGKSFRHPITYSAEHCNNNY